MVLCPNLNLLVSTQGLEFCVNLTELNASHNQLTSFPAQLVSLQQLNELSLTNNQIASLHGFPALKNLMVIHSLM
jgi:Leucine-rich repeat (LRR) protein